ncbi:hypothetical protein CEUSTIGMA_g4085.t1 [Chlamydomonas eustigma]|uniref:Uncharacterized protein n=1 Tax=Chlamydomonas eustigma TaxID=1157962 RepID=A0A250X131_9CHLO|nr:hypothetical protein CEUSTIGMA_g4085.t1 [Chlamydomonas eustigma]|eukprot:GAX76639.1 hypothetical protein CEUSTIGMA_g4085.t1 [Chlamydomonas eustigma]
MCTSLASSSFCLAGFHEPMQIAVICSLMHSTDLTQQHHVRAFLFNVASFLYLPCLTFTLGYNTVLIDWGSLALGVALGLLVYLFGLFCGFLMAYLAQNTPPLNKFWQRDGAWLTQSAISQAAAVSLGAPQAAAALLKTTVDSPPWLGTALAFVCTNFALAAVHKHAVLSGFAHLDIGLQVAMLAMPIFCGRMLFKTNRTIASLGLNTLSGGSRQASTHHAEMEMDVTPTAWSSAAMIASNSRDFFKDSFMYALKQNIPLSAMALGAICSMLLKAFECTANLVPWDTALINIALQFFVRTSETVSEGFQAVLLMFIASLYMAQDASFVSKRLGFKDHTAQLQGFAVNALYMSTVPLWQAENSQDGRSREILSILVSISIFLSMWCPLLSFIFC